MFKKCGWAVLLVMVSTFIASSANAQIIRIGRSSLTVPDFMRWAIKPIISPELAYTGDKSGGFPLDAKLLLYRPQAAEIKAILISRVTPGGLTGISMRWNNQCPGIPASPFVYKRDRSTSQDVDCLLVAAFARTQDFVDSNPQLKMDLDGAAPDGNGVFYIEFSRSLGSGGYVFSQLLVSQDFKGLEGVALENSGSLPTTVLAWAEQFAKNNRDAIQSFSGDWILPSLVFGGAYKLVSQRPAP